MAQKKEVEKLTVQITFGCGCGVVAKSLIEARDHATSTGHTMVCHGVLKPIFKAVSNG